MLPCFGDSSILDDDGEMFACTFLATLVVAAWHRYDLTDEMIKTKTHTSTKSMTKIFAFLQLLKRLLRYENLKNNLNKVKSENASTSMRERKSESASE